MANWRVKHGQLLRRLRRPGSGGAELILRAENSSVDYQPVTGKRGPSKKVLVGGWAIAVEVEITQFIGGELTFQNPATLLFVPITYGDTPTVGMVGVWGGKRRTVRAIRLVDPDGVTMAAHLVLA